MSWDEWQIEYLKTNLYSQPYCKIAEVIGMGERQIQYYVSSHHLRDKIPKPVKKQPVPKPRRVIAPEERLKLLSVYEYFTGRSVL